MNKEAKESIELDTILDETFGDKMLGDKMKKYYQQGDVLIEEFGDIPKDAKNVPAKDRGFVLFEGDATNHAHAIKDIAGVNLVEKDGVLYIVNKKPSIVTHEEHKPITIPAGSWRVRGVQEYDHFAEEARRVID